MVLALLSGHSPTGTACLSIPGTGPGASTFPVSLLDARDREPLHGEKRHDRLRPHSVAAHWGSLIRGNRQPKKQALSDASCCMQALTFVPRTY